MVDRRIGLLDIYLDAIDEVMFDIVIQFDFEKQYFED
jgi:hypothetical protein